VRLWDASCLLLTTWDYEIPSNVSSDSVVFKSREPRGQEATETLRKHPWLDEEALLGIDETGGRGSRVYARQVYKTTPRVCRRWPIYAGTLLSQARLQLVRWELYVNDVLRRWLILARCSTRT
jgi:hypothetical protein